MAVRDKLRENAQPFLEPGETIEWIVPAQCWINPWLGSSFGLIGLLIGLKWMKFRLIARTDRSLVLLEAGLNGKSVKSVLKRLPRTTPVGPLKGVFAPTVIDGEKLWVHRRFTGDVNKAPVAG